MNFARNRRISLPLLIAAWLLAAAFTHATAAGLEPLAIETKTGSHKFSIELANTMAGRQKGLMYRPAMPAAHGMLFDFRTDQIITMWMKNTILPLDMIFIARNGRIHRIEHNTQPFSLDTISSGVPVRAVLEINGGIARRLGIEPGDKVIHKLFGNQDAR
jgi:uncharacterized membrane protein (UPF0127 family)